MSLKIAKEKARRNLYLCFVQPWCRPLQSNLLWPLRQQMPKKQQGSHMSPGPPEKREMLQRLKTLQFVGILIPIGKQPHREGSIRGVYTARLHQEQAFLIFSAKEHFHTYCPTSPPGQSIQAKERWSARNRVQVVSALNRALAQGHVREASRGAEE